MKLILLIVFAATLFAGRSGYDTTGRPKPPPPKGSHQEEGVSESNKYIFDDAMFCDIVRF